MLFGAALFSSAPSAQAQGDAQGDGITGEIRMFAGDFAPRGWAFCDGQILIIQSNRLLYSILGTTYGGDGRTTFSLPDLRGRVPIHATAENPQGTRTWGASVTRATVPTGSDPATQSTSGVNYIICLDGIATDDFATNFCTLGEVRMFAGKVAPKGWAFCDGQSFSIQDNQSLYSILGTTYGGDGRTTFFLPDLRGRVPIHATAENPQGRKGGGATVEKAKPDTVNRATTVPNLGIRYFICVQGIFPSRN